MTRKLLSVLIIISFFASCLSPFAVFAASNNPNPSDFSYSIMEQFDSDAISTYIGTETVFYKDKNSDTIYVHLNGVKKTSSAHGFTTPYFDETGDVYIKAADVTKITGITSKTNLNQTTYSYNGKGSVYQSQVIESDGFISLTKLLKALGYNTYIDNRGFVMTNFANNQYENKVDPYAIQYSLSLDTADRTDAIFRHMNFDRPTGETLVNYAKNSSNKVANLLITPEKLALVKAKIASNDPEYVKMYNYVLSQAESVLRSDCVEYDIPDKIRLFNSCITVRDRIITLATAYLLTDDTKYLDRIWKEMSYCLDETHWPNWNCYPHSNSPATNKDGVTSYYTSSPGHFLDSGKITPGIAIGYDLLRATNYLTNTQKAYVRQRVKELLLDNVTILYNDTRLSSQRSTNWHYAPSNWGAVVPGGIMTLCLSFAKDADEMSSADLKQIKYILENTIQSLEFPYTLLYPDGSWYEGPSYWQYVAEYLLQYCYYPLKTLCGDDYGFMDLDIYKKTFDFKSSMNGPVYNFNYGETGQADPTYLTQGFLLANLLNDSDFMQTQYNLRKVTSYEMDVRDIFYYDPDLCNSTDIDITLDKYFTGADVGVLRDHFYNSNSAFVAFKAGQNTPSGSQYEKGTFVFDLDGVRWAADLGSDNYNARDYIPITSSVKSVQGRKRFYRYRTEGNNCIVINPEIEWTNGNDPEVNPIPGQTLEANTVVKPSDIGVSDTESYMKLDLTPFYTADTTSYVRGYYLGDNKSAFTLRDEITFKQGTTNTVYWFMHTQADISISPDGKTATLTHDDKKIILKANTSSAKWSFGEMEANYLYPKQGGKYDEETGEYGSIVENGIYDYVLSDGRHFKEGSRSSYKKVFIKLENVTGNAFIEVKMSREGSDATLGALSTWKVDTSKKKIPTAKISTNNITTIHSNGYLNLELEVPHGTQNVKVYSDDKLIIDDSSTIYNTLVSYPIDTNDIDVSNLNFKVVCEGENIDVDNPYDVTYLTNQNIEFFTDFSKATSSKPLLTDSKYSYSNSVADKDDITFGIENKKLKITFDQAVTTNQSFINIGGDPRQSTDVNLNVDSSFYVSFDYTTSSDNVSMYLSSMDLDTKSPGRVIIDLPKLTDGRVEGYFNKSESQTSTYVIYIKDNKGNIVKTYKGNYNFKSLAFLRITPYTTVQNDVLLLDNMHVISYDDIDVPNGIIAQKDILYIPPYNVTEIIDEKFTNYDSYPDGTQVSGTSTLDYNPKKVNGVSHLSFTSKAGGLNIEFNDTRSSDAGFFQTSTAVSKVLNEIKDKSYIVSFDISSQKPFKMYISSPSVVTKIFDVPAYTGKFYFLITETYYSVICVDQNNEFVANYKYNGGATTLKGEPNDTYPDGRDAFLRFTPMTNELPNNVCIDNFKLDACLVSGNFMFDNFDAGINSHTITLNDQISGYSVYKASYSSDNSELLEISKITEPQDVKLYKNDKLYIWYKNDEIRNLAIGASVKSSADESIKTPTMLLKNINDGYNFAGAVGTPNYALRTCLNPETMETVVIDGKTYYKGTLTFDLGDYYNISSAQIYTMFQSGTTFDTINIYDNDSNLLSSYKVDVLSYEKKSENVDSSLYYGVTYTHPKVSINNVTTNKIIVEYLLSSVGTQVWFQEVEIYGSKSNRFNYPAMKQIEFK